MRYGSVKHIALYYKAIPGMLRLLRQERAELEGNYYGLRGLACDGMPRGSSPGKPTEESGLRALENGVSERLAEIAEAERVLSGDEACIRACLDALNGRYKEVIVMRYVRGYSWAKISARMGTADSTARDWHTRAVERLGKHLGVFDANNGSANEQENNIFEVIEESTREEIGTDEIPEIEPPAKPGHDLVE